MDAFEPEYEDAPEPEEGEEKGEPVLVNKEEKDGLDAALAEAQAGFSGPALERWPLLAQVLLLSNEFLYVD